RFPVAAAGYAMSFLVFFSALGNEVAHATAWRSTLGFRAQGVGTTSAVRTVTLHNSLPTGLPFGGATASGDFAITTAPSDPCGAPIPAGASCSIGVTFTPTQIGARAGTLSVNAGVGFPYVVLLKGTGSKNSLSSIAVIPVDPTIPVGGLQQFNVTGFFPGG